MEERKILLVHEDSAKIIAESKEYFESVANKVLSDGDIEMLLINALAYREMLLRSSINEVARQNLVDFSTGSPLEYLGALVGVSRLPASPSLCTIQFSLVADHTGIIIPEGTRVQSLDGKVIFITTEAKIVAPGVLSIEIPASCTTDGVIGNGYEAGKISIILDPVAYVSTATNIAVTNGGSDQESDIELRERIKLAPASFSNAGSKGAYKYFAKSAHPGIVDVEVISPNPGEVEIFPLMEGGEMPSAEVIEAVYSKCNDEKVRPLTDTVIVSEPTKIDFAIEVDLTVLDGSIESQVIQEVTDNLNAYKEERKNNLGNDVKRNQINALSLIKGKVYDVNVVSPALDIVAAENVFTNCTGIIVNVVGSSNG